MFQECIGLRLLITNVLISNNSVSNPDKKIITLIKMTGARVIKMMQNPDDQMLLDGNFKMSNMTCSLKRIVAKRITKADQLNTECKAEFGDLLIQYRKSIETKHEIDETLKSQLMAMEFRRAFNITSSSFTEDIVLEYFFKRRLRSQYLNMSKMLRHKNYDELQSTYLDEMLNNLISDNAISHLNRSVYKRFTYPHCQKMVMLFKAMNVRNPVESNGTHVNMVNDEITRIISTLKHMVHYANNTGTKIEVNTKIANNLLSEFGISLKKPKKNGSDPLTYRIFTISSKFEYKPEKSRTQHNFIDKPIIYVTMK